MADFKISTSDVSATAARIRSTNVQLNNTLKQVTSEINGVASSWDSTAAATFQGGYGRLKARFDDFQKTVDAYAAFLDRKIAVDYEAAESSLNKAASQFK